MYLCRATGRKPWLHLSAPYMHHISRATIREACAALAAAYGPRSDRPQCQVRIDSVRRCGQADTSRNGNEAATIGNPRYVDQVCIPWHNYNPPRQCPSVPPRLIGHGPHSFPISRSVFHIARRVILCSDLRPQGFPAPACGEYSSTNDWLKRVCTMPRILPPSFAEH